MSDEPLSATFLAQFPDIQSAIKAGADMWRVQLDIPKSEHSERKKLLDWMGVELMVTIVPVKKRKNGTSTAPSRRKAKIRVS